MHIDHHYLSMHIGATGALTLLSTSLCSVRLGVSIVLVAITIGCDSSPSIYPVSGQVLIDGVPATTGSIRFMPDDGRPAMSNIDEAGQFNLVSQAVGGQYDGVKPGRYRVAVTSNEIVDAETARWFAPAKYADFRTSGLEVEVDRPLADVKIELTWDGASRDSAEPVDDDATVGESGDGRKITAESDASAVAE